MHSFSSNNVPFDLRGLFEGLRVPFSRENEAQEMTIKLLALTNVCSVLVNIRDVSWHLSKRGSELEKKVNICIVNKTKDVCTKILKPAT